MNLKANTLFTDHFATILHCYDFISVKELILRVIIQDHFSENL